MTLRRDRIESLAAEVLRRHGIDAPPVPIEQLVKAEGAKISAEDIPSDISGFLYCGSPIPVVGVNARQPLTRRRFSMAHELGHLLMHSERLRTKGGLHVDREMLKLRDRNSSAGVDPEEVEANAFAASILMPRDLVMSELEAMEDSDLLDDETIRSLARRFRVSDQAITIRLNTLGISF
jgi:Zn-dependent peptidase ImmA (M78 family)